MQKIGRHTYHSSLKVVEHEGVNLRIGQFCSIGPKVTIILVMNHRTDCITTYPFGDINHAEFGSKEITGHPVSNGDVIIGNDVWIGCGATIMSGLSIGDGAVIAANSHVVKDVDPYSITGGNPARHIKYRFSPEVIAALLALKWWDKTDKEIRALLPVLMAQPDVETIKSLCK